MQIFHSDILLEANGKESDAWYPSPSGDFIALEYVSKKVQTDKI